MGDAAFAICAVLLFVFCAYIGFLVGNEAGSRAVTAKEYWRANAVAVVTAVLLVFALAALPLLCMGAVGLLGGCIAGLKMGFGESVGPWKLHDRFLNVNRAQRRAAADGTAAARRRRKRTGEAPPDLMSVESTEAPGAPDDEKNPSSKKHAR